VKVSHQLLPVLHGQRNELGRWIGALDGRHRCDLRIRLVIANCTKTFVIISTVMPRRSASYRTFAMVASLTSMLGMVRRYRHAADPSRTGVARLWHATAVSSPR